MSAEGGFKLANCPLSVHDFNLMFFSLVVTYSHFMVTAVPFLQIVWLANRLNGCTKRVFSVIIRSLVWRDGKILTGMV